MVKENNNFRTMKILEKINHDLGEIEILFSATESMTSHSLTERIKKGTQFN